MTSQTGRREEMDGIQELEKNKGRGEHYHIKSFTVHLTFGVVVFFVCVLVFFTVHMTFFFTHFFQFGLNLVIICTFLIEY